MSGVIPSSAPIGTNKADARSLSQWPPQGSAQRPYPEMPQVSDTKPLLQSLGATGVAVFSGIITSEEYNPDFYWRDGVRIYEQMLRSEAQIRAIRTVVENPIKRATWSITPGSDDPRDHEIASFVESCLFHDMRYTTATGRVRSQPWQEILHHILMHLWYGFMAFEINWRKEDGWVKWSRWTPLLPRTVWRWWVGPDTELAGIQQWTFKDYNYAFVDIPADKLLLFVNQQEGANYEGLSLLRTAYKNWWYKQNLEKIEAIGIERNAVAPPIITLPENYTSADVSAAQQIGANIRANEAAYVTLPPGWLLDFPAHMQAPTAQVQPAIHYHDIMIARNVLAQFINLGSTETGAYALADAQQELFLEALQAVALYITDVINADAIKRLVDYNFDGVEVYPQLKCARLANADISQVADALAKLKARDANFINPNPELEDYLAEQFGFPKPPKSVTQATNPTAKANAQRPENANAQDHGDQESAHKAPAGQKPNGQQAEATAANNAIAPASPGDGGPALSEASAELRLLREAVASIAGLDAVERGMVFFNPNHDARGRFAAGSGPHMAPDSGGSRGGGRTARGEGEAKASGGRPRGRGGSRAGGAKAEGETEAKAKAAKPRASRAKSPEEQLGRLREREAAQQAAYDAAYAEYTHAIRQGQGFVDSVARMRSADRQLASIRTRIANLEKSPAQAHAAKAAKLKAALDKAQAAAAKAQAAYDAHMAKAPKQASEQSAHAQEAARLLAEVERAQAALREAQAEMERL